MINDDDDDDDDLYPLNHHFLHLGWEVTPSSTRRADYRNRTDLKARKSVNDRTFSEFSGNGLMFAEFIPFFVILEPACDHVN